jgi:hypothetical protein
MLVEQSSNHDDEVVIESPGDDGLMPVLNSC